MTCLHRLGLSFFFLPVLCWKGKKIPTKEGRSLNKKKTRGLSPKMCFLLLYLLFVKKGGKKEFFFLLHVNLFPFFCVFHDVLDFVNEHRVRYRKWEKKTNLFLLLVFCCYFDACVLGTIYSKKKIKVKISLFLLKYF